MNDKVMTLEARLARVERSQRIHRRASSLLAVALAATLGLSAGGKQELQLEAQEIAPISEILRTKRIDIVDEAGRMTCTLMTVGAGSEEEPGAEQGTGLLVLRNAAGKSICRLGSRGGSGAMSLHQASGATATAIGAFGDGGSVELYGGESQVLTLLRAGEGAGTLALYDTSNVGVSLAGDEFGNLATTRVGE